MATTPSTSSSAIDSRRAQQLAERALALSERGDLQGAVLACRQSIALNPAAGQGYSMLGMLLERAGDSAGAITAYEKVLELDPGSLLERESLGRLRTVATQRRTTRDLFAFDDKELFEDERPGVLPAYDGLAPATPPLSVESTQGADADDAMLRAAQKVADEEITPTEFALKAEPGAPGIASANETTASAATPSTPAIGDATALPLSSRAAFPVPSLTPDSASASTSARAPIPASLLAPPPSSTPVPGRRAQSLGNVPAAEYVPPVAPAVWEKLRTRPSHYFRGAPLAATAIVSMMFLLWAHNYASSRDLPPVQNDGANTVVEPGAQNPNDFDPGAPNPRPRPGINPRVSTAPPVNPGSAPTTGRVPSNPNPTDPTGSAGTTGAVPGNPSVSTPAAATPATSGVPANPGAQPVAPAATTQQAPTDALPPATAGGNPASGGAPARPATGEGGSASTGGSPVPVGGAPGRGFARVAPPAGSGGAPARAAARAARDERTAAGGGNANSGAIDSISRAIETGGSDVATRFQQRAQLYLNSGDNARAISDFQSAISAYNDMINRGDRVSLARSGVSSCQRGIQIAQSRVGR